MIAARKIIDLFEQQDCDTIQEAEDLCADAGYVYDEDRGEHVYTPLRSMSITNAAADPIPEREHALDAAVERCRACPQSDCRDCGDTTGDPIDWKHPPRRVERVGEDFAAEILRRAIDIGPKSARGNNNAYK